jgi:hypothetical protein
VSDSLLEDEKLTTADIARPATPRQARAEAISTDNLAEQPIQLPAATDNPSNGFAASTNPATSAASASAGPLFPDDELHNFRARWDQVQTSFVDEPRQAVEQADTLVANVVKRIAEQFANERGKLENQWAKGDNVNTEDLRQSLKRYRSFFDRLLAF